MEIRVQPLLRVLGLPVRSQIWKGARTSFPVAALTAFNHIVNHILAEKVYFQHPAPRARGIFDRLAVWDSAGSS